MATAGHEAGAAESIDITAAGKPALQAGANVFAIVLLNVSLGSSDASMIPELTMEMERGVLEFSSSTYSCSETDGTATITVTRSGGRYGAVSVSFATSDGSAVSASDEDYTATSGTLSWGDGDTAAKTFPVTITDDGVGEPAETVLLAISIVIDDSPEQTKRIMRATARRSAYEAAWRGPRLVSSSFSTLWLKPSTTWRGTRFSTWRARPGCWGSRTARSAAG